MKIPTAAALWVVVSLLFSMIIGAVLHFSDEGAAQQRRRSLRGSSGNERHPLRANPR